MADGKAYAAQAHRLQNNLLAALHEEDWSKLKPHLEVRVMKRAQILFEQGENVDYSTFPCDRMVASMRVISPEGTSCEVATIGREGAVGGIVSHGRAPAFTSAIVETGGAALVISTAKLEELKGSSPALRSLFARYSDCLLAQIMQGVACNALHDVEQRIARWLLSFQDRTGGEVIPVTQEDLAAALGVGRPYASRQLNALKGKGLVELRRSAIEILDRAELTRVACGCQRAVKRHFDRVLEGLYPDRS